MSVPAQVWSCGGGTQSAAIAALIVQGRLPKPDFSFIIDTKRERASTWRYYKDVLAPAMQSVDVSLTRVDRDLFTEVDLYSRDDKELMLPVYTVPNGKLSAYCSGEWKRDVAMRYMRRTLELESVVNWIGYSTDEMRRVSTPRRKWCQLRYPLIEDVPMNRNGCKALIESMGWPPAPRSSCFMCPHHSDEEWQDIKDTDPEDFARAVDLEREIRGRDGGVYLSPRRIPLQQINFKDQMSLEYKGSDCTGGCFT